MATSIIRGVAVAKSCRQNLTNFFSHHNTYCCNFNNNKSRFNFVKNNHCCACNCDKDDTGSSSSTGSLSSFCCSSCCCLFSSVSDEQLKVQTKLESVSRNHCLSKQKQSGHKHLNRRRRRIDEEPTKTVHCATEALEMTDINRNGIGGKSIIMTSITEKREHLYKILVIGELGTGKTSFIKRYVHQFFSQNYRATIGVDFALKVLHWDPNTIVRLQLWDIAGQERFGNMTRVYYKEAVGAFLVFDVTRSGTFDCVIKWKEDLDSKVQLPDGSPIPCILLANKCDQEKQGIATNAEKLDEFVKQHGFAGWYETSAKENINIDESARALVNKILLNDKLITAADIADSEKFNLAGSGGQSTAQTLKEKCAC